MKFQQTFNLNRLRCDLAMKQALKNWQAPKPKQKIKCPRCRSISTDLLRYFRQWYMYTCHDCQHTFRRRPKTDCSCSIPGQKTRCEHCPYFEQFLNSVKQKSEKLKNLSQTQLEDLLDETY